ncbi:hypothetical protein GCM10010112_09260 [Actinoplanes lobatus]|uniref:Nucleotidyltransferase AbiEii toxin of type IV toxin-antitoxin system n=1 Tax=Actinoplanes lobatus TaxID=113568 RepID=A0A7W7HD89_9ACTN|nr:nucleotidyl transferase AbiEii/AbiGii toxin family protein [Actinoplanes lobatus]MBB4748390.1 hypothetical protein [Actinoplanes lobatus]GGN56933.1 hypothetical protein GCM10010112_09260 [Actinoplanes lobatus]GIE37706.1 hypothetical protein Alo02nite_06040 [Actinoplanes lobatus]
MTAHRAALDHILGVVAEQPWAECLVLRGSMTMASWVGDAARPPGDIDWVVWPPDAVPVDYLDPYPVLDRADVPHHWPEAARHLAWTFQEFDSDGPRSVSSPDHASWVSGAQPDEAPDPVHDRLEKLLAAHPRASGGVVLDASRIAHEATWDYTVSWSEYSNIRLVAGSRARMVIPWTAPGGEIGSARIDLAYDEVMADAVVRTPIRRADGLPPTMAWTASRELSLAWKMHWLTVDQATEGVSAMKDVYDAVLLAELDGMRLSRRLRRLVLSAEGAARLLAPSEIPKWVLDAPPPDGGSPGPWLARLATAVDRLVLPSDRSSPVPGTRLGGSAHRPL